MNQNSLKNIKKISFRPSFSRRRKMPNPAQLLQSRFEEKMHLLPIEVNEILCNDNMEKNPGW
jgi:hypothetical protein